MAVAYVRGTSVRQVVKAMLLEEASAALQENACASLGNLAINAENQVSGFGFRLQGLEMQPCGCIRASRLP